MYFFYYTRTVQFLLSQQQYMDFEDTEIAITKYLDVTFKITGNNIIFELIIKLTE